MDEADTYVTCTRVGGAVTVVPHGEFDIATVDLLGEALRGVGTTASRVVVDLRDVDFLGLAALDVLLDAHRRLANQGCILVMVGTTASVLLMVRALGESHLLAPARVILPETAAGAATSRERPAARTVRQVSATLSVQPDVRVAVS